MKKSMIVMLCIALLALNAVVVAANVSPYISMKSVNRRPTVQNQVTGCTIQIDANPADIYFLGKARKECVDKNPHNVRCQNTCFSQVKLLTMTSTGRSSSSYARAGCNDIDPVIYSQATVSQCHFIASNGCVTENPNNEFCRKKCVQKAYNGCRQQRTRTYAV
jgi:hypothetical protein